MKLILIIIVGTVSVLCNATKQPREPDAITVSFCEILASPERYDGKLVTVRANYGGTWEGLYLSDPACSKKFPEGEDYILVGDSYYPGLEKYKKVPFRVDRESRRFEQASRKLCNAMIEPCEFDYIMADFTGVIAVKRGFKVSRGWGNGFGHLGMSKTALLWQSVSNVYPHPKQ